MRNPLVNLSGAVVTLALGLLVPVAPARAGDPSAGRALAYDVGKGNCLACHAVPGDAEAVTSANIGPPLVQIRARFPQRGRLLAQLEDPMQFNPETVMPPFGKHRILTPQELDLIVDFLYTL